MVDWSVLGINPTKDKDAIRDAYRTMLAISNPEDDANKFMKLRKNYEEALAYANNDVKSSIVSKKIENSSIIEEWIGQIIEIYNDFEKRIDEDTWRDILSNDVCIRLDYKIEAQDALLFFLSEHYNIPQSIWIIINDRFDLIESKEELYDSYPKDFIDNVIISSINYPDLLDYTLFNVYLDVNFDDYIALYYALVKNVREKNIDECSRLFEQMEEYGDVHPYTKVEKAKYLIYTDNKDVAYELACELYEEYPDNEYVVYILAESAFATDNIIQAKELYQSIIDKKTDNYYAQIGLADCLMKEHEYEKAKEMYIELHKKNPYDSYLKEYVEIANNKLISIYEEKCKENSKDAKIISALGWCYLQNSRIDDAYEIIQTMCIEGNEYDYYNLLGRCYLYMEKYELAHEVIVKWIETIKNIKDVSSPENQKRIDRLSYAYELLCQVLQILNKHQEAMKYIDIALELKPDDEGHLEAKARLLLDSKKYEECIIICEHLKEKNDTAFIADYIMGVSYYRQRKYVNAYDKFGESIGVYPFYLPSYIYRIKILLKYNEHEKAKELIEYLENNVIKSDLLEFYKTKVDYDSIMFKNKDIKDKKIQKNDDDIINDINEKKNEPDYDAFREKYLRFIYDFENGKSDIGDIDEVYYEIAGTYMAQENYASAIEYAVKSVNFNENNMNAVMCLAYAYEKVDELRLAIEANKKLLELNPMHFNANNRIAELHEEFYEYEEAVYYHTKQLEINSSQYCYLSRGLAYLRLDCFEEARNDFFKAIEVNPDNPHPYNNIGASYQYEDNYEEAIKYYKMAIERLDNEPSPLPYRNLATIYMRIKDAKAAVECYQNNIRLFNRAYDYEEMALALYESLAYKEAVEIYTKRCKYICDNKTESMVELYVWVGKCNLSLGAEKTALKYFMKAIEESKKVNIRYASAYVETAQFYYTIRQYDMAIKYYSEVETDNVLDAINYADYASALLLQGEDKKADEMIDKAFIAVNEMDDRHLYELTGKYFRMGYCYTVLGDYEQAKIYFEKALSHRKCNTCDFPKCCEALGGMAYMYEKMGEMERAAGYYKEALSIAPSNICYIYGYKRTAEHL